ncbi:MAG: hypothetical protein R6U40_08045 [Desulfobacterales bacterium]
MKRLIGYSLSTVWVLWQIMPRIRIIIIPRHRRYKRKLYWHIATRLKYKNWM